MLMNPSRQASPAPSTAVVLMAWSYRGWSVDGLSCRPPASRAASGLGVGQDGGTHQLAEQVGLFE
jgi:hypothetical protein